MGTSQSTISQPDDLPISPVILKLRKACKLYSQNEYTESFINYNLSILLQKNNGPITRSMNPFCIIECDQHKDNIDNENKKKWIDCCLISPIMAIASPSFLINSSQKKHQKARLNGLGQHQKIILSSILKVYVLQQNNSIALLIFQRPMVDMGWVGITYIQSSKQICQQPLKSIGHNSRQLKMSTKGNIYNYKQQISRVKYKALQNNYGDGKNKQNSLIFKLINKKPYLIGIQVNENQCKFFNKQIFSQIKFIADNYLTEEISREILEKIDINAFQLMQKI